MTKLQFKGVHWCEDKSVLATGHHVEVELVNPRRRESYRYHVVDKDHTEIYGSFDNMPIPQTRPGGWWVKDQNGKMVGSYKTMTQADNAAKKMTLALIKELTKGK